MHARELVDVAGLVALNGPLLVCGMIAPSTAPLEQYWSTSKLRFECWSATLKLCAAPQASDHQIAIRATLDEIFTSEILTRVWSAVLVGSDRRAQRDTSEPIARSVLGSHIEARRRALSLMVGGAGLGVKQIAAVNRVRRRAERWTDVLIGGLWHLGDVREFAVEPERAEDFAVDLSHRRSLPGGAQAWRLTLVSMRNAFQTGLSATAANPDANARIMANILGCFPAELFDSTGIFHSLWMRRMSATATDAQGMISDLLQSTRQPDSRPSKFRSRRGL